MKKFLFLVLFLSSCAHSHSIANPATKLSYRCTLESEMCFLVDCGAKLATEEGYPTYRDDKEGELVFVPGEIRTVFFGTEVPTVGHFPLVSSSLVPGRI